VARSSLPDEFRNRSRRHEIGRCYELAQYLSIERGALRRSMQLFAVYASRHKQAIKAMEVRASDIGFDRIANYQDRVAPYGPFTVCLGQFECPRINWGKGLASHDDLPARPGIAFRDRARAVKMLAAILNNDIWIGA
jgi:hypothetical protein